jgi:alginate O-acetyltransferase complex protein AlgI
MAVYFAAPRKWKNMILLVASLFFYFWGEPIYVFLMTGAALAGWVFSLLVERFRGTRGAKIAMIGALVVGFGLLGVFKYADFFVGTANSILRVQMPLPGLLLPIGISFYTFQIASYIIDVYRGQATAQRNFFTFFTYVAMFPQLMAGPIIRYADVVRELEGRRHSLSDFGAGARRFTAGLAKKVLLANTMFGLCEQFRASDERSVLFAWLYIVAYALHLYFDFSGYSDMAIGLGRVFGFRYLENFNYPYISKSITEFWRRWHMSLGAWFRDYVYIPMGGSRVSRLRFVRNIFVVWMLTGFWHGAGWTFIVWGLYFGVLLLVEKMFLRKALERVGFLAHLYTLLIVMFSFVLFDAPTFGIAIARVGQMLGAGADSAAGPWSLYYLRSYALPLLTAAVGCTPLPKRLYQTLADKRVSGARALTVLEPLGVAVLLALSTAYLIDGSFNPFIYFRF